MPGTVSHRPLQSLFRDRRGVASIYFAGVITTMVLLSMAGLDMIRIHMARSRILAAADAALLAAGSSLGNARWGEIGANYFNANMDGSVMGTEVTIDASAFKLVDANGNAANVPSAGSSISLTIETSVSLLSAGFLDIAAIPLTVTSKAKTTSRPAEVAMVLDHTGSMTYKDSSGTRKIDALQAAANTAIDKLAGTDSGGSTFIGLIPFNETVRVGNDRTAWLENGSASPMTTSTWEGCVYERVIGGSYVLDVTTPSTSFAPYSDTKCTETKDRWGNVTERKCDRDKTTKNGKTTYQQTGCTAAPINFLTSDVATLKAAIEALDPEGNPKGAIRPYGSTMIASGLVWGWRMLSHNWQGITGLSWGDSTLPRKADPSFKKIIVLLTDGNNAVYGGTSGNNITYYSPFGDAGHVDVTYDGKIHSSISLVGDNNQNANDLLSSLCWSVKNDGIILYTITFGSSNDVSQTTRDMMKACATQPENEDEKYYFHAPNTSELQKAFSDISGQLSTLRLVDK
jgi:hypothetical protein